MVVNISGGNQMSQIIKAEVNIGGREVTSRDIDEILEKAHDEIQSESQEVIHCIPVEYKIDGMTGITKPEGMIANRLGS